MSRKVLIGNLSFRKVKDEEKYHYLNEDSKLTSFTTIACVQRDMPDEVIIIVSDTAVQNVQQFSSELKDNGFMKEPVIIRIDDDVSERMLWKIYDDLYQKIQDGDEVYIDITGGKRPVSTITIEVVNYIHQVKNNVSIKELYYGDSFGKDKKFYEIGKFIDLTEWAIGIQNYIHYADARYLLQIISGEDKNSHGYKLVTSLDLFSRYLSVCQWEDAYRLYRNEIKNNISLFFDEAELHDNEFNKKLKVLQKSLDDKFHLFDQNHYVACIQWCFQHRNNQQALTLLNEIFKKRMVDKKYVSSKSSFEVFKKINGNDSERLLFEKENNGYRLSYVEDSSRLCLIRIKSYLDLSCTYGNLKYLVKLKTEKEPESAYNKLNDIYKALTFPKGDGYKTLKWFLSYILADLCDEYEKGERKELSKKLGISTALVKRFGSVSIDSQDFREEVTDIIKIKNDTFDKSMLDEELLQRIRQYSDIYTVSGKNKADLQKSEYQYENKVKSGNKDNAMLPFPEEVSGMVSDKFYQEKEEMTDLFAHWNIIRDYRNYMDHAQLLSEDKREKINFVEAMEKGELKNSIDILLNKLMEIGI